MTTTTCSALGQWPGWIARVAGGVVSLVGVLVLLGWALDIATLKSVVPGWVTMRANTALAFAPAGVGLVLVTTAPASAPVSLAGEKWGVARRRTVLGCAGLVALIGLLTLSESWIGWDLGIDQLVFNDSPDVPGHPPPRRMAPATTLHFLLLGCALPLAGSARFVGAFQVLTLLGGLIGWLGLSHYLYGGEPLLPYAQMAIHTALSFLFLSAGVLSTRTDGGLMALLISDSAGGVMARRLLPPALCVPLVFGWLRLQGQHAGWYSTEAGTALFALSHVLVFGAPVWANAARLQHSDTERKHAEEKAAWLASFSEHNPNPVSEVEWASGVVDCVNPCAARLFPELQRHGLRHPWLAGLHEAAAAVLDGSTGAVRREIVVGDCCYVQTLSYIPAVQRLRVGMPYVDGRQIAHAVKAASPTTPVALLTGWGQRLVAEREVPPQVDHVLSKPPNLRELRATLAVLAARVEPITQP